MKGFILDYINENEYRKLERALKKYKSQSISFRIIFFYD